MVRLQETLIAIEKLNAIVIARRIEASAHHKTSEDSSNPPIRTPAIPR
jgi:hypothetical protein